MSWSIQAVGNRAGVRKIVRETRAYGDQTQIDAAKAFIDAELMNMGNGGIKVVASGHHTVTAGTDVPPSSGNDISRSIHIHIEQFLYVEIDG